MPTAPSGRSWLAAYWPEVAGVGLCLVLLGPMHVNGIVGTVLALVGYGLFRWIGGMGQKEELRPEPTLEDLLRQLGAVQASPRLLPFQNELAGFNGVIRQGLLSLPKENQDMGLRELTRETVSEILRYAREVAALPRTPEAGSSVYQKYRSLLTESANELGKSYAAVNSKDDDALATQIEQSRTDLQSLHQQLREEE